MRLGLSEPTLHAFGLAIRVQARASAARRGCFGGAGEQNHGVSERARRARAGWDAACADRTADSTRATGPAVATAAPARAAARTPPAARSRNTAAARCSTA